MARAGSSLSVLTRGAVPEPGLNRIKQQFLRTPEVVGHEELWKALGRRFPGVQLPDLEDSRNLTGTQFQVTAATKAAQDAVAAVSASIASATTKANNLRQLIINVAADPANLDAALTGHAEVIAELGTATSGVSGVPITITESAHSVLDGCQLPHQWGWAAAELGSIGEAAFRANMASKGFTQAQIDEAVTEGTKAANVLGIAVRP